MCDAGLGARNVGSEMIQLLSNYLPKEEYESWPWVPSEDANVLIDVWILSRSFLLLY